MASDTLTSFTVTEDLFEEAPAPEPFEQTPDDEGLHTSPRRPGIDTQHDSANLRDKKRKAQCPSHGSIPFQIQLVEMLQKNGCAMKMHDDIIDLINNGLITGSLNAANPPLLSRKNVSSRTGL